MTIDRQNIRRLYNLPTSQAKVAVLHAVPDLLDELDESERRVTELKAALDVAAGLLESCSGRQGLLPEYASTIADLRATRDGTP